MIHVITWTHLSLKYIHSKIVCVNNKCSNYKDEVLLSNNRCTGISTNTDAGISSFLIIHSNRGNNV